MIIYYVILKNFVDTILFVVLILIYCFAAEDINLEDELQHANILSREPTSLFQSNIQQQEEDEEDDDLSYRDDQSLLGEYRDNNNNNNINNGGDVELRIPVRLQKRVIKKKQVLHRPYFTIIISIVDVLMMMYAFLSFFIIFYFILLILLLSPI